MTARWERYAWAAGIVFVAALLTEAVVSLALPINQNDSAAKIAAELDRHSTAVIVAACFSVVYAVAFVIWLRSLHRLFGGEFLILVGGVLFVALHAVSDIGIYGMLGSKVASYAAQHDQGLSYTLYLLTFALDSVGDVFGSLFLVASGLLALRTALLPRWLAWLAIPAGILFFLQGFGLGGVVATFGLVLDLIGFVLFLVFVVSSSVVMLRPERQTAGSGVP